ncbi:hypothetical protein LCGC14_0478210 [marine sediment metagenome]|uniref:Large polyvalent protein associated domain-containing protein n=1 Tax=marine sediment metagenome TaxID=412755 RepID=A0A0F9UX83_9ZZZZ
MDWTDTGFNPLRDEEEERRVPWRDPRTGEMLELRFTGTPSTGDRERLIEEARARKSREVEDVDPGTAFVRGAGEKAKAGIEWAMDAPVLKPISEALRKPGVSTAARMLIPGYAGVEAATGLVAGAGAALGTMWDQGVEGFDPDIVKEEAGEGIHTALEMVAPIDVAAIGLTGGAGIAAKLARSARGLQGARVLGRLGQAADVSEGLFGGGQFLGGLEEGNLAEMGVGLARAAGGAAGAAWIPDVPSPKQLGTEVVEEFLPERIPETPSDVPDLPGGETMNRGPFDVSESWGSETGAVEFGGKRPPEPVKLDPLPEDPNALIDLWGGGEGSSHFSRSAERAGSYPGTPRHVQITRAQFDEFHAEATKQGLPATDDVFLPNDIVKQSVEDPSAQPRVWEGEGGEDVQAILKELEVEEFLPPARTGSEQITEGGLEGSYQEGVVPVQKGVQGVQEGVQPPAVPGRPGEVGPLEEILPPELAPVKAELDEVTAAFKTAVESNDTAQMQPLANRMSELNDEIAGGLDTAKQGAIDVEAKVIDDVEPYDQVPDDIARVEADADAAILEADALAPIKNLRLRQVTADSGRLDLALDKGTTSPDMIEQMLKDQFPEHSIEVAPMKAGLGWGKEVDLHHVTFWKNGRLDYKAAERAQELLGGKLLREAPGMEAAKPPVRSEEPPIKPPAKPALEAVVPTAKGQSFNEFMQEKFGDKRTTGKERAIARAEYKAGGEAKKLRQMAEDAGIPPERLQEELNKGPEEPEAQNIRVDEWIKNPVRSNFEKIHPGLAAKFDDYFSLAEEPAMRNIAELYNLKRGLNKSQRKEAISTLVELDRHPERNLDDLRFDDPQVEAAVRQVRMMVDKTWDDAVKGGVRKADDRPRKNYFPRKFAEGWEDEALQSPKLTENWEDIDPHLEKPRLTGRSDYRRDWDVLDEYFIGGYRRISEVQTFGKGLKELRDLLKTLPVDPMTSKFVRMNARRVLGREPEGLGGKVLGTARHTEALADLGLAPFYQPIQYVNVGLHAGFGRSVRGLTNFMTHYGDETYRALRSGALTPNISQEVIGAYGGKSTFYPRAVENFMYGIPTTDKFTRIPANTAGRLLVQDALESKWYQTRYAKWSAGKDLKGLGFDVSKIKDTPEWHEKVGKALSDKALYRTGAMEVPGWFSSPAGKLGSQYTRFMYRHSIMIGNLFKEAAQGNVLPLTRFLTVSMPIIQGASEFLIPLREGLREAIKQSFGEDPYDLEKIKWEALGDENAWDDEVTWGAILRNKRIPMSHPYKRALQNFAMYGGIGLYQMIVERIFRGGSIEEKGAQWLGPVIGTGMEAVGSIAADVERATEGEWPRHTPRVGLQQIPVGGYQAANRLFPPEEQGRGTRGERRRRAR